MESLNISLPDTMKNFVESQLAAGNYATVSEYVRALIREDEKRNACERLEAKLTEGLRSRKKAMNAATFAALRKRAKASMARKAKRQ